MTYDPRPIVSSEIDSIAAEKWGLVIALAPRGDDGACRQGMRVE